MWQRCALVVLALALAPAMARAQASPTRFLPSGSQIYFHWDGQDKHQAAFAKSAVGKMMAGDTGKFLRELGTYFSNQLKNGLANAIDAELAGAITDELFGAHDTFFRKGVALGVELRKVEPVDVQAIFVFPGGGAPKKSLYGLLQTLVRLDPAGQVKEANIGKHKGYHVQMDQFNMTWFTDQGDLVLTLGTNGPDSVLKGTGQLAARPAYKQATEFKEFETCIRGFVDLQAIGKVVSKIDPKIEKITGELGLKSILGLTFHTGFDGPAVRSVTDMHIGGPRQGILKLASDRKFGLKDLPPMPPDITDFSATMLDLGTLYDIIVQAGEIVARLAAPEDKIDVKGMIKGFEQKAGVKLREDLFNQFDTLFVNYAASAEGILGLGGINLIKVKNGDKVLAALNKLTNAAKDFGVPGIFDPSIKKKDYHGVPIYSIDLGQGSAGTVPTFTVYKGWLAYASYPQPIQGFILRAQEEGAEGALPVWEPSKELQGLLKQFPKEFTGITVNDPRPAIKAVLSVLPIGVAVVNAGLQQVLPGTPQFDVSLIPNAYEATRYLFPSVTITSDNGKRLRSETRSPF